MKRRFRKVVASVLMLSILATFLNLSAVGEEQGSSGFVDDVFDANSSVYNDISYDIYGDGSTGYGGYCYDDADDDDSGYYIPDCEDAAAGGGGYPGSCPYDYPEDYPQDCLEGYCVCDYDDYYVDEAYDYEMFEKLDIALLSASDVNDLVSLNAAISDTGVDVINLAGSFDLTSTIIINRPITIRAESAQTLTLHQDMNTRHFNVVSNGHLTLEANVTLHGRGGTVEPGVTQQAFPRGGGVYVASGGTLTLDGATITNNRSNDNGGGVDNAGTFTMISGTISANATFNSGGGVHNRAGANFTMSGGTIGGDTDAAGNIAHVGAGVGNLSRTSTGFTMSGTAIISNNTTQDREILSYRPEDDGLGTHGGGVRNSGTFIMEGSAIIRDNSTVHSYEDGAGGGVWQDLGSFEMRGNARIYNNKADHHGGGVYINEGSFTMSGSTSINNNSNTDLVPIPASPRSLYGGGVFVSRNAAGGFTMRDSAEIHSNSTTGYGGGVATQRTFTMSGNAVIRTNEAYREGGGVFVSHPDPGNFVMNGGTIHTNTALRGGGVYNANTFTMSGGTIGGAENQRNEATAGNGGGVFNAATGRATISAGTISFNTATISESDISTGNGGGIFTHHYPNLTVSSAVTFNENVARPGSESNFAASIYAPIGPVPASSSGGGAGGFVEANISSSPANVSLDGGHPLNNFDINFTGMDRPVGPNIGLTFHPNGGLFSRADPPMLLNETITRFPGHTYNSDVYGIVIDAQGKLIAVTNTVTGSEDREVPIPTRQGWRFVGWSFYARVPSMIHNEFTIVNPASHTLFAHWERIPVPPEVGGAVDTNIPQTGDSAEMAMWLAVLLSSLAGGIGLLVWKRKRIFN